MKEEEEKEKIKRRRRKRKKEEEEEEEKLLVSNVSNCFPHVFGFIFLWKESYGKSCIIQEGFILQSQHSIFNSIQSKKQTHIPNTEIAISVAILNYLDLWQVMS